MKNIIVFFSLYSLIVSSSNLIASEKPSECRFLELPAEIIQNHITCYIAPLDVAMLKQTNKCWNTWCDYWMCSTDDVEKLNEVTATKMLSCFARTEQEKNFEHFLHNNKEKREEALKYLGWSAVDSIKEYIQAYCVGVKEGVEPDWYTIFKNRIAVTIVCLSNNPNKQNNNGDTALMWASWNGYTDIVKLLLAHQSIDVNTQNTNGYTALIWASYYGKTEIVKLLLAHQADVNKQNNNGDTALIWASGSGHKGIVELLLAHQHIDINQNNNHGYTALMWASWNGYTDIVKLLLAQQAIDINKQNNNGDTALIKASGSGLIDIVELLQNYKQPRS